VDAVFVGEAFHWFSGDEVLREIARVLRPGGILAILFNQRYEEFEPPLSEEFWETYRSGMIEKPPEQSVSSGVWRTPFPGPFEPLTETGYPNPVELDRAMILAAVSSQSTIAALPDPERTRLLAELGELVSEGEYVHRLRTDLFLTRLT
jgi:SAM-dependent methyltransferase